MYVFCTHIQSPFRCIPWTRIVWSQRNLCSALIDTANQLSKMVVRIYIQINRVQKTQWFHIFFSFWYFSLLKQLFQEWYTISYCGINLYFLMSISSSRGSCAPRDQTQVSSNSCLGRHILLPLRHVESPKNKHYSLTLWIKVMKNLCWPLFFLHYDY